MKSESAAADSEATTADSGLGTGHRLVSFAGNGGVAEAESVASAGVGDRALCRVSRTSSSSALGLCLSGDAGAARADAVVPGSAADRAGLRAPFVCYSVDDESVADEWEFRRALAGKRYVTLDVERLDSAGRPPNTAKSGSVAEPADAVSSTARLETELQHLLWTRAPQLQDRVDVAGLAKAYRGSPDLVVDVLQRALPPVANASFAGESDVLQVRQSTEDVAPPRTPTRKDRALMWLQGPLSPRVSGSEASVAPTRTSDSVTRGRQRPLKRSATSASLGTETRSLGTGQNTSKASPAFHAECADACSEMQTARADAPGSAADALAEVIRAGKGSAAATAVLQRLSGGHEWELARRHFETSHKDLRDGDICRALAEMFARSLDSSSDSDSEESGRRAESEESGCGTEAAPGLPQLLATRTLMSAAGDSVLPRASRAAVPAPCQSPPTPCSATLGVPALLEPAMSLEVLEPEPTAEVFVAKEAGMPVGIALRGRTVTAVAAGGAAAAAGIRPGCILLSVNEVPIEPQASGEEVAALFADAPSVPFPVLLAGHSEERFCPTPSLVPGGPRPHPKHSCGARPSVQDDGGRPPPDDPRRTEPQSMCSPPPPPRRRESAARREQSVPAMEPQSLVPALPDFVPSPTSPVPSLPHLSRAERRRLIVARAEADLEIAEQLLRST